MFQEKKLYKKKEKNTTTGKNMFHLNTFINNLSPWLYKYRHLAFILYMPFYLYWFISLEKSSAPHYTYVHCFIDDYIPFHEIFIIPYLFWFLYVTGTIVFLFFQTNHLEDYCRYIIVIILGMTTSLIIYTVWPNAQNMRPHTFTRDNILTQIIDHLYRTDTDTNVCPSIHVYNSLATHVALCKSHYFKNKKTAKRISLFLCVLICLSTVMLKQHSIIDLVCATALYIVFYTIVYRLYKVKNSHAKRGRFSNKKVRDKF